MIERDALADFGVRDGVAYVAFKEGREVCYTPEWRGDSVRRITVISLLDQGCVSAKVDGGCFWSNGEVSQQAFGAYCAFAIALEREVYRLYRRKKIDEAVWREKYRIFWKIVIKSHPLASALEQCSLASELNLSP